MKTQAHLSIVESFAAPPEALFARLLDHEGMSDWMGARISVLSGPPDGGAGTVRRVEARGLAFDEEITYVDAPRRMAYRIVGGVPLLRFHRGEILVEPWGKTGAELTWDILLDAPVPGLASVLLGAVGASIRTGLGRLRTSLLDPAA